LVLEYIVYPQISLIFMLFVGTSQKLSYRRKLLRLLKMDRSRSRGTWRSAVP